MQHVRASLATAVVGQSTKREFSAWLHGGSRVRPRYRPPSLHITFAVAIAAMVMTFAGFAAAQPIEVMRKQIGQCEAATDALKVHAWVCALAAFAIAGLGVLLANLDRSSQLRKWLAGALSAIIAFLTFVTSTMYPDSAKGLFDTCAKGYQIVENATQHVDKLELHALDALDLTANQEIFERTLSGCAEIRSKLRMLRDAPWIPTSKVHAGEAEGLLSGPPWIRAIPTDSHVIYFLGTAHDATLRTAQAEAMNNARQQIEQYIVATVAKALNIDQPPEGGYQAARRLAMAAASAGVADTYWRYDEQTKLYSYHVLFRLQRAEIEQVVTLWLSTEGVDAAERAGRLVSSAPGPSAGYQVRRQQKYAEVLDRTRKDLSPELYEQFLSARESRKREEVDPGAAIATLEAIVRQRPDLYLGWFNLAIAYQRGRLEDRADEAFRKALSLEEEQKLQDPSIASTYGVFLYRRGRYAEAVKMMDRALATEPEHPYAKYYRRLAAKQIPEGASATFDDGPSGRKSSEAFR